jgi:iron complex outermembrane recepter protein
VYIFSGESRAFRGMAKFMAGYVAILRRALCCVVICVLFLPDAARAQTTEPLTEAEKAQRRAELLNQKQAIEDELHRLDTAQTTPATPPAQPPAAQPAPAQPGPRQPAPPAPAISVPQVTVSAPPVPNIYEAPASQTITTIDRDVYKDSPAFSAGQILQYSPGVTIKQGNGPRDVGISIRGSNARNGFGVRNIQVFEDGFPETQPDGLSRTDLIDPHAYAGFDVYRGPSSALFGNYATGGAINFRTRHGGDINGFEVGSDVGSFGYLNEYATFGNRRENYEYSLFGSWVHSNGYIEHSRFNTETEDGLVSYTPTLNDTYTFKLVNNDLDTQLPIRQSLNQYGLNPYQKGCSVAATAGPGCPTVSLFANGFSGATVNRTASQAGLGRNDRRTIVGSRWEHSFDADTNWRTQFVFDNRDISQPTGATSAVGTFPSFNLMSDVTQNGRALGFDETHLVGVHFNYLNNNSSTFNLTPAGNAQLGGLTNTVYGHHYNAGVRAREEVALSTHWTAVAGIGAEYTNLSATNTLYTYTGTTPSLSPFRIYREFYNVAPEAGLLYKPTEQWTFRGRVSTGYGTPQLTQLTITSAGVPGNNTSLETQTNVGYDLGVDWTPDETVRLGLTGFYEFFHNEMVTQSPGAGLQNFTFNAPRSEHRGIEAVADWRFWPGWRMTMAYTYDNQIYSDFVEQLSAGTRTTQLNRAGNKIPGVEPHFFTGRLGYEYRDGSIFSGLGAFAEVSWREAFFMDNANLIQAPSYTLVNLNAHYDPQWSYGILRGLRLFFEADNVLNKTYVASANNVADSISAVSGLQNPASVVANAGGSIYAGSPRAYVFGGLLKF